MNFGMIKIICLKFKITEPRKTKGQRKNGGTSSTSLTISTKEIQRIVDKLQYQQHRDSTKENYLGIWRHFNQFYLRLDVRPDNWEDRLILFVAYLIEDGKQSSTIKSYVSAVRTVLKREGFKLNNDCAMLSAMTRACRLHFDRYQSRTTDKKNSSVDIGSIY